MEAMDFHLYRVFIADPIVSRFKHTWIHLKSDRTTRGSRSIERRALNWLQGIEEQGEK